MRTLILCLAMIFSFSFLNAQVKTVVLKVKGISCDECVKNVRSALTEVKGVKEVKFENVNFKDKFGIVKVSYKSKALDVSTLAEAVEKVGFEVENQKEAKSGGKIKGKVVSLNVSGITCGGCVKAIESALKDVEGVKKVEFKEKDFEAQKGVVQVVYSPDKTDVEKLKKAIISVGFGIDEMKSKKEHKHKH